MITIDLARARELINECIDDRGEDYVYEKPSGSSVCLYVHHYEEGVSSAGCIVGMALNKAGIPLDEIDTQMNASHLLRLLEDNEMLEVSNNAVEYLQYVQDRQDKGATWADARAYAELEMLKV